MKPDCAKCGHRFSLHVVDRDGKAYGVVDNIGNRGVIFCDVAYPNHAPHWSWCECDGYAADTRTPDQIADDLNTMAPGNFI